MNMIEFGLSDFSLLFENGEKLNGIKSILCYSNEIFRKVLEDPQVEDPVPVADTICIESMILLFKYYGGGKVEIDEDNVSGLLLLSLYYNEKRLFNELKSYAINHMNEKIVKDLLNSKISINNLNELCYSFIRDNIYLMLENEILNEICLDGLKYILSLDNIIIGNENVLLNSLLKYYKVNKDEIEKSSEYKNKFNELLEYVNWEKVEIKNEMFNLQPFDSIKEIVVKSSKHKFNRYYCSIPKLSNSKFHSIIQKYYINPELLKTFEEEYYYEMCRMKIDDDIKVLLECEDIKVIKILLIILLRLKNEYEIPKSQKWKLLLRMFDGIDNEEEDEEMNIESLSYFIDCIILFNFYIEIAESIKIIYETYGYKNLLKVLNIQSLSPEKCDLIIDYLQKNEIVKDEETKEEIKKIIKDEEVKNRLLIHPLTMFKYDQNEYEFVVNQNISIKCECDGEECEFSIKPELPNGLKLNKRTGDINGKVDEEIERREYEIECKQMKKEMIFKISLKIIKVIFTENYKTSNIIIIENGRKITCTDDGQHYYHCYLNMKLEKGIYHFKYKSTFSLNHRPGFGVSTINNYDGNEYYKHQSSLCIWIDGSSKLFGSNQVTNPDFTNHNGDEYEFIVNMKERTISIKQNNGTEYQLFNNIPSPLYPFVSMDRGGENIELLSFSIED